MQLVKMGRKGTKLGFQFPVETGFPVPVILIKDGCPELRPESWVKAETCEYTHVQVHMCISTDMYTHTTYTHTWGQGRAGTADLLQGTGPP